MIRSRARAGRRRAWLHARARRNEAQHLAVQITKMRLLGCGIAFPDDALVGYLHTFRRVMELGPPVAVADFRTRRSAIARDLAVLRFPAVAARGNAAWLKPFGIVVGVVEMVAVVLCSGPRRGGEDEHQEGDDERETDIGSGRRRGRRCFEPVGVKTATAAILLAAYRPDLADLFRAPAAAVADVTFDVAQSHHGLHYILPITLLDFRTSCARSCALDRCLLVENCGIRA